MTSSTVETVSMNLVVMMAQHFRWREGYDRAKFHLGFQDHNYIIQHRYETSIYHLSQADAEIGQHFTDGNHVDIELLRSVVRTS